MLWVEYFRAEDGRWLRGDDKPGYTPAQVWEEASALYWFCPGAFPNGIRVVNRQGVVKGIKTDPTVSVLVLQNNVWKYAPINSRNLDMQTALRRETELRAVYGANNVRIVNDTYPIETTRPEVESERKQRSA